MDSKTVALSLLIAVIMGSSGAVVYTLSTTNTEAEQENIDVVEVKDTNAPPKLMIDEEITRAWNGETVTVEGYVYDENLATARVLISVLNENFNLLESMNLSVLPSGKWSAETSLTGPGSFLLDIAAVDAEGLESLSLIHI